MPPNTVSVTRPGKWGNPFKSGEPHPSTGKPMSVEDAIDCYMCLVQNRDMSELRGKNLACYCPLDKPCHADVLLEWANKEIE